jgi:RNA 3'-terminal phosphate cyclase (ATP)
MLTIDGSYGEGGGQILRTTLALSITLGQPVRLRKIRAGRSKPGLAAQHLTCVQAAAEVCGGTLGGATLGSQEIELHPGPVRAGEYRFQIGTAGATTLVLQTVLPALLRAGGPSQVTITGGTNVPWSPPYEYLELVFGPTLGQMGLQFEVERRRVGFYPKGGGELVARVQPASRAQPLDWSQPGPVDSVVLRNVTARVPRHVLERQEREARRCLEERGLACEARSEETDSLSPGTMVFLSVRRQGGAGGFTGLGERGKPAEVVARQACEALVAYLDAGAARDCHLADQVLLYLALADGTSRFTTERTTQHLLTNAWVIEQFLGATFEIEGAEGEPGSVTARGHGWRP